VIKEAITERGALEIFLLLLFIGNHWNSPLSTLSAVTLLLFGISTYFRYTIGVLYINQEVLIAVFQNSSNCSTSNCALKTTTVPILKTPLQYTQVIITFGWLIGS
jgi:hypothetical protein